MRASRLICAAAVALSPATVTQAAAPYDGLWALDRNYCLYEDDDGTDLIPIEIEEGRMTGYTYVCDLQAVEPIGTQNSAWYVDLSCRGGEREGEYEKIFGVHRPHRDSPPDVLTEIDMDDGSVTSYVHCEPILH